MLVVMVEVWKSKLKVEVNLLFLFPGQKEV